MNITNFKINEDRTQIDITIDNINNIDSAYLFTNDTFKDYNKGVNIINKIPFGSNVSFTLDITDGEVFNKRYFDGIYFLEVKDNSDISTAYDYDFTRYKECILDKISNIHICNDCLNDTTNSIVNSQSLLLSLEDSMELGYVYEAFNIIKSLDKYCSNECKTCNSKKPIPGYYNSTLTDDDDGEDTGVGIAI